MANMTDLETKVAKAICQETCAFYGEPPCWSEPGSWPSSDCEPGCLALAKVAIAAMTANRQPSPLTQTED